jgi:uncharacterized membrane protein required for colicin V production
MNWLDLALVLFAIIFIIIGLKKGFMTSVLSSFSFGAIAIAAFFLYRPILSLLNNWFGLENAMFDSYYDKLVAQSADFEVNLIGLEKADLRPFVRNTLKCGAIPLIPRIMFNLFLNNRSLFAKLQDSGLESRNLGEIVSSSYANFFSVLIAFAITYILICLIVLLFKFIVNKLRNIGFVKVVDDILGSLYGVFRCFIILVIISVVINLLAPMSFMEPVVNYINGSFLGNLIYGQVNNIIDNLLGYSDIVLAIFG